MESGKKVIYEEEIEGKTAKLLLNINNKQMCVMYGDECLESFEGGTWNYVEASNDGDWVYPALVQFAASSYLRKIEHDNDPEFLAALAMLD